MKASTAARASSSAYCTGGDFMKYEEADSSGPPMPRSLASLAARIASEAYLLKGGLRTIFAMAYAAAVEALEKAGHAAAASPRS